MKKIIFGGIAVLTIVAITAWNVNLNSQKNKLSDISLANMEALASEGGNGCDYCCYDSLYNCYTYYSDGAIFYCPNMRTRSI
jgi:hypothetical protein